MRTNTSKPHQPYRRDTYLQHSPKKISRSSVMGWTLFILIGSWLFTGPVSASSHYNALRVTLECSVVDTTDPALATQIAILGIHESKKWTNPALKTVGADFFVFEGTPDGEIGAASFVFDASHLDQRIGEYEGHYRTPKLPAPWTYLWFNFRIDRTTLMATRLLGEHRIEYACEVVDPSRYLRALKIYEEERERIIKERQRKREAELRERRI